MPLLEMALQAVRTDKTQAIAVGATATTATAVFNSRIVQISPDISVNFLWGSSPTAATTDERLPANSVIYKKIERGQQVSVITTTGTATGQLGTVWISEVVE